jgi:hypothetical protein
VVYGAIHGVDRRRLLQHLSHLKSVVGSALWLLAGDFNVVRGQHEKWGSAGLSTYEKEFVECIHKVEIEDLPFTGWLHTWSNKQAEEDFVSKKLDRVMTNLEWLHRFGNTSVDFLEAGVLNHSPALVTIERAISYGPKPFKFFNFWADHSLFMDWVKEGWRIDIHGYSMFKFYAKLNSVKKILKIKNLKCFGGLGQRVRQAKHELAVAQAQFLAHDSFECQRRERECMHAYISISAAEENFLKQKSINN